MKLRTKFILLLTTILAAGLAANTSVTIRITRNSLVRESIERAKLIVEVLEAGDRYIADLPQKAEDMVGSHMVAEALLTAHLVDIAENSAKFTPERVTARLRQIADNSVLDEFWITDEKAHAYIHNVENLDFTFPEVPTSKDQAYHFRRLLNQRGASLVQQTMAREVDGVLFKYAGVSGIDRNRIVQVGYRSASLANFATGVSHSELIRSMVGKGDLLRVVLCQADGRIITDIDQNGPAGRGEAIADPTILSDLKQVSESGIPLSQLTGARFYVAHRLLSNERGEILLAFFDPTGLYDAVSETIRWSLLTTLLVLIGGLLVATALSRAITRPITALATAAVSIAEGDLHRASRSLAAVKRRRKKLGVAAPIDQAVQLFQKDETAMLLNAVHRMAEQLNLLAGKLKESSNMVNSAAAGIATSARILESGANGQSAATDEMACRIQEISSKSQNLANTMREVAEVAGKTIDRVDSGRTDLALLEQSMARLGRGVDSIMENLKIIRERAKNITSVVEVINRVVEKTNLLSLNAAIEAEKAGEYGRSFSVIAREMSRLSESTAAAGGKIESSINEMGMALLSGLREIERSRAEAGQGLCETSAIRATLATILDEFQALKPKLDEANQGVQLQAESARQVVETISTLRDGARETADSLHKFNQVTTHLREVSEQLGQEVSRFRTG